MWLEQFSDEFFAFASMGRELFNRVHGCAHHPIFLT